jgi:hypothetical protein
MKKRLSKKQRAALRKGQKALKAYWAKSRGETKQYWAQRKKRRIKEKKRQYAMRRKAEMAYYEGYYLERGRRRAGPWF